MIILFKVKYRQYSIVSLMTILLCAPTPDSKDGPCAVELLILDLLLYFFHAPLGTLLWMKAPANQTQRQHQM